MRGIGYRAAPHARKREKDGFHRNYLRREEDIDHKKRNENKPIRQANAQ